MKQTNLNTTNYTSDEKEIQEKLDFAKEIINMLPKDIEETVKKYKAIERKREVKSGIGLLQVLMLYATAHISIKILSVIATNLGVAKITDTAWRKQMNKSVLWLTFLVQYAITQIVEPKEVPNINERNIYLIDASSVKQEGKESISYRIHMSYNLKRGCMDEIKVTDHHIAESFKHFDIEKKGIYIADAGYGRGPLYEYILSKEADVIFRITPNNFIVVDKEGKPINLFKILRTTKKTQLDIKCFIKRRKKLLPIRIIISRIPEEKIEGAIKRKKREATKRQSKIKPETLEYAKWIILATSLDESYSADEILRVYCCRWQIELLFKRFKQHLKIKTIRKGSENYALALVHIWLLIWCIVEKEAISMEIQLIENGTEPECISIWYLSSYAYFVISTIVVSSFCLTNKPFDISDIAQYLTNNKRSNRENQFAISKDLALGLSNFNQRAS